MSVDETTLALMEKFRGVAHIIHTATNARMSAAGLTLARFRALTVLHDTGPMRMNTLSTALGVVPRTVTSIIDALEDDGLLQRSADPTDRRATQLQLTAAGTREYRRLRTTHDRAAAEIFKKLTNTEKAQLARLLDKLDTSTARSPSAHPHEHHEAP